jgi:hypothetical protein
MGKKFSQVKRFSDEKKWEDEVEWFKFPDDRMVLVRFVGDLEVLARHWIKTMSGKMFPTWCPRMDSEEEWRHERPCPAHADFEDKAQKMLIANAIIRQMQERGDPNPVKGVMLPHAVNEDLSAISELIKADVADPADGVDIAIKFSSKAIGNKKWSLQRGDRTPLTEQENRYRFFDFGKIVPNFTDKEVAAQYAKTMREAMGRQKYYVVPDGRVPANARDPFKYFRGDARGQPWNEFAVLVDYKNAEKGDSAGTYRVSGGRRDGETETLYEENEASREQSGGGEVAERAVRSEESVRQSDAATGQAADDGRDVAESAAGSGTVHPDGIADIEHPEHGTVPECFGTYSGIEKCSRCPIRSRCVDNSDETDM